MTPFLTYLHNFSGTLQIGSSKKVMVAMKFTPEYNREYAKKEFEMYAYLGAINNTNVSDPRIDIVFFVILW